MNWAEKIDHEPAICRKSATIQDASGGVKYLRHKEFSMLSGMFLAQPFVPMKHATIIEIASLKDKAAGFRK